MSPATVFLWRRRIYVGRRISQALHHRKHMSPAERRVILLTVLYLAWHIARAVAR